MLNKIKKGSPMNSMSLNNKKQQKKGNQMKTISPNKGTALKNPKSPNYRLPKKVNNKNKQLKMKKTIIKEEQEDEEMESSDNEKSEILTALKQKLENNDSNESENDSDEHFALDVNDSKAEADDDDDDDDENDDDDDDDDENDDDGENDDDDDDDDEVEEEDDEVEEEDDEESDDQEESEDNEKKNILTNKRMTSSSVKIEHFIKNIQNEPQFQKIHLSEEEISRTLHVGNWPMSRNSIALSKYFSKYGDVEHAKLWVDKSDNRIKDIRTSCKGFVRFAKKKSALNALVENTKIVDTHHLSVNLVTDSKKPDEVKALYVGNIPYECEDDDLWELFEKFGKINSVRVGRKNGANVGYGFVNFDSEDSVTNALKSDFSINDRILYLKRGSERKNPEGYVGNKPFLKRKHPFTQNRNQKIQKVDFVPRTKPGNQKFQNKNIFSRNRAENNFQKSKFNNRNQHQNRNLNKTN